VLFNSAKATQDASKKPCNVTLLAQTTKGYWKDVDHIETLVDHSNTKCDEAL